MAGQQVFGVARIRIDGQEIRSLPDATLTIDGFDRENVYAGGDWNYREIPQPGELSCKIAHTKDLSMRYLMDLTDALVVFDADNGKTFHMRNARTSARPVLTGSDGAVALEMSGSRVEEQ